MISLSRYKDGTEARLIILNIHLSVINLDFCEDTDGADNCQRLIHFCKTHKESLTGRCDKTCGYCSECCGPEFPVFRIVCVEYSTKYPFSAF